MTSFLPPAGDPPTNLRRRIPGSRVLLIGALIVVAITAFVVTRIVQTSGPGPDPRTIPKRPGPGAAADAAIADSAWVVPTRLSPILADSALRAVVVDGEREILEPGLIGWRILDEPQAWLIDHAWFYVPRIPVELHTYAEMKALDARGAIGESTRVEIVSYRWKLHAASLEEARREALRQIPTTPPAAVAEAVKPRPRGE
jgi:hypothetical protein